ncbi:hypothetical protein GCM10009416_10650 [Craurococcus roseus]|uniref:Yip1 domain-containing protein n=1 Tax=Craurococcus roseus TaxID=77585 RepID=A0ABN1ET23_9PROT
MIEAGLRGAFMLARGQAHGAMLIEDTPEGAARSFWAAALCLPGLLALMLFDWAGEPPAAGVGHALLLHLLARGGGWAGFAVASHALAQASGRVSAWPHFIAAWNWANVVQYLLFLAVSATAMLGLPGALASALALATLGYQLWLVFFLARTTLGSRGLAMAMLGLDLLIGVTVEALLASLSA